MSTKWKEAATVILTCLSNNIKGSVYTYNVLALKRSAKSSFMPNTYVFPGGITDAADHDQCWLNIFQKFNVKFDQKLNDDVTPPILKTNNDDAFPKIVALKITAIRETFEETGILLCRNNHGHNMWDSDTINSDLQQWRQKVEHNAAEFFNLCEHFNCCPSIDYLHVWSNWLTPVFEKKRFDTIFFFASLPKTLLSTADKNEIDHLTWSTPKDLLEQNANNLIKLPPPQLYELSRLMNFTDGCDLASFAQRRSLFGCELWMPLYIKADDGLVGLLPGDDAHHIETYNGSNIPPVEIGMTKADFHSKSTTLHRIDGNKILVKNYSPPYGHILPVHFMRKKLQFKL